MWISRWRRVEDKNSSKPLHFLPQLLPQTPAPTSYMQSEERAKNFREAAVSFLLQVSEKGTRGSL